MSGGEVAGLLVAVFWAILVSFLAVVLARLAQTLKAATELVAGVTEQALPLLGEASVTVRSAQSQLDRVDAIAADVQEVARDASALSSTVSTTFGGPLVKVAAFSFGVRRALGRKTAEPRSTRTVIVGGALPSARRRATRRRGGGRGGSGGKD